MLWFRTPNKPDNLTDMAFAFIFIQLFSPERWECMVYVLEALELMRYVSTLDLPDSNIINLRSM